MSYKKKLKIAIIGATGFTGLDLVFILSKHPKIKIHYLCATKNLGKKISFFDKRIKNKLPKITSIQKVDWSNLDLVFLSLPNNEAQKIIRKTFYKFKNLRYIDLSADFRIFNKDVYLKNYKTNHKAQNLIKKAIYSISEFAKNKVLNYRIISNPGCYPTSVLLPIIPIIKKNFIDLKNITIDSKSGYSGAGKNLKNRFSHKNLYQSIFAYNTKHHRHICEIEQEIYRLTKKNVKFTFNPHLLPTFRGILSTIYIRTKKNVTAKKIRKELLFNYKNSKFIKILKLNDEIGTGNVINTNYCEISVCETRIKNKIVIFSAIDNLVKGASGQAVQNMNLLFKYPESLGLL